MKVDMPRNSNSSNSKPMPFKPIMPPMAPVSFNTPSLFQSVKEGFGFGLGSTIARNLFSTRTESLHNTSHIALVEKEQKKTKEFKQCMETSNNNYDECVRHLE